MFRAYRPIFRRVHTAVHTTIGSVSVPFRSRALYVVPGLGDCSLLKMSTVHHQEYVDTVYTQQVFVMLVLLAVC